MLTFSAKETDKMDVNDLGFVLVPDHGPLKGVLLAFALGENGKPIDLNLTRFRRSKKNLRKRQNSTPKEKEEKEEKLTVEEDTESLEVYVQGCLMKQRKRMFVPFSQNVEIFKKSDYLSIFNSYL